MPQNQTMTLDEKLAIGCKAAELWEAGDKEGYVRLMKTAPLPPYLAKVYKEKIGAKVLPPEGKSRKGTLTMKRVSLWLWHLFKKHKPPPTPKSSF